jgi:rhamnosyltransferase
MSIRRADHWVVVPLHGPASVAAATARRALAQAGLTLVLVDNNAEPEPGIAAMAAIPGCRVIWNGNRGGIAGGFNRGIAAASAAGAGYVTLLDQDSAIEPESLDRLREPLQAFPHERLLVGPRIWDQRRGRWHQPARRHWRGYPRTRLLISSGTTFAIRHLPLLGPLDEGLFIDFVDHAWCFRAQAAGFVLLQPADATLEQQFGARHPHWLCRRLGLELYSPQRHFCSLRNLRWLLRQGYVPIDLRLKEALKMLVKPWLWLLFEPQRRANARAIVAALRAPLPADVPHGCG